MHKKNKGKNKPKNPNPTPPQQPVVKESEPEKEEVRVPEIIPEVVLPALDSEPTTTPAAETPAKPKRHRAGKKRKQNDKQEIVEAEQICEQLIDPKITTKDTAVKEVTEDKQENKEKSLAPEIPPLPSPQVVNTPDPTPVPQDEPPITVVRKKKGKQVNVTDKASEQDKKIEVNVEREEVKEVSPTSLAAASEKNLMIEEQKVVQDVPSHTNEKELKSGKKKNKKNKNESVHEVCIQEPDKPIIDISPSVIPQTEEHETHSDIKPQDKAALKKLELSKENIESVITGEIKSTDIVHEFHEKESSKKKKKNKNDNKKEQNIEKNIVAIAEEPISVQCSHENPQPKSEIIIKEVIVPKVEDKASINVPMQLIEKTIKDEKITEVKNQEKIILECIENVKVITETHSSSAICGDDNNNLMVRCSTPQAESTNNEKLIKTSTGEDTSQDIEPVKQVIPLPPVEHATSKDVKKSGGIITLGGMSEKKIDNSNKFLEDLLISDKMSSPKSNAENIMHSPGKEKEEEFIIRLFDKPLPLDKTMLRNKPLVLDKSMEPIKPLVFDNPLLPHHAFVPELLKSNTIKQEPTDLKGKVLEVNKDMEDLKLSIEKSLAELTAIEADDMPELVAITECATPPCEVNQQEAISVINVESQILLSAMDTSILQSATPINLPSIDEANPVSIEMHETKTGIHEVETEKSKEKTLDQYHKKNKGKGKSSVKSQDPLTIVNLEKKEITPRSKSPIQPSGEIILSTELVGLDKESITAVTSSMQLETGENIQHPLISDQEHKGKGKGKNKKKTRTEQITPQVQSIQETTVQESTASQETQKPVTVETSNSQKESTDQNKKAGAKDKEAASETHDTKQESVVEKNKTDKNTSILQNEFNRIDNIEDVTSSSFEDASNIFEIISSSGNTQPASESTSFVIPIENEDIFFDSPAEPSDVKPPEEIKQVENPLSAPSKNLLGHPDIPVTSNKNDYKKEKNKNIEAPNTKYAKIKINDSVELESKDNASKSSKQSQTENKMKSKRSDKSSSPESDNEEEYVYKYSFRKVFLTNTCLVCKVELKDKRLACGYCNLVFYCSQKHKDEDWSQHQALCFAVSTISHLKGLKFIYSDASGLSGQEYRLLRMQVIVSCEKILKRKLLPCEQEALLYPRTCSEVSCREWKAGNLADCEGCRLVSYCSDKPEHLSKEHQVWCKSYRLYYKLVTHQQSKGRLEPRLPSKIFREGFTMPDKINELLVQLYEDKIELDDIHYAALTQLATAPLTAAYSHQLYRHNLDAASDIANGAQDKTFTLHVVGAELQFEADTLSKWEVFFLHLQPSVQELRVVFVGPELNPSKLPLDLLAKIKMCKQCRQDKRRILFDYQDGQLYHNYATSQGFTRPDIVCAFNPGLHRTTGFGGVDSWPDTINCILRQKAPFCVTSYTKYELPRDALRIRECSSHQYKMILEPTLNPYASIRPDRNFISDDEMPLIFKNYYFMVLAGVA